MIGSPILESNINKFNYFLTKHYVSKEAEHQNLTHTALCPGRSGGRYNIPENSYDEFFKLYCNVISDGIPLGIIERPNKISPIRIDIDFRFNEVYENHLYNKDDLERFVLAYYTEIQKYCQIEKKDSQVFIYEISKPVLEKDKCKDGIHILFPNINTTSDIQHIIRNNILEIFGDIFSEDKLKFINSPDDIIDKSIIDKNGWIMYGSSKPNREAYKLTYSYLFDRNIIDDDISLEEVDITNYELIDIIKLSSIRNKTSLTKIKDDKKDEIKNYNESKIEKNVKKINKSYSKNSTDVTHVKQLLDMLNKKRFDNYNDWLDIGIVLFNISNGHIDYLNVWDEYSQNSTKYQIDCCQQKWNSFEEKNEQLDIGSLMFWAQNDNPEAYIKFTYNNDKLRNAIQECLRPSPSDYDLAQVINLMYDKHFKYDKVWYQFKGNLWECVDNEPLDLSLFISRDVFAFFKQYVLKNTQNNIDDMENYSKMMKETGKAMEDIYKKLKNHKPKESIIKECRGYFHEKDFFKSLNQNEYLIGFNNGIYDLKNKIFRNGRPTDKVTYTTGYDFIFYDKNNEIIKEVEEFIFSIQPDINICDTERRLYLKKFLASCLEGGNIDETFVIFTGSGRNGKSKLIELMEKAMGDYAGKVSVSCITKARGKSSDATPEIIALKGKRFVSMVESDKKDQINNGMLKELTGGDMISGRGLFKDQEEFKPQFKFILGCNDIPGLQQTDDSAFYERLRICDFPVHFTTEVENEYDRKIDDTITKKIPIWGPYFMAILINWYHDFFPNGQTKIKPPQCVISHNNSYRTHNDEWNDFFHINKVIKSNNINNDKFKIKELYDYFKLWYPENCVGKPPPIKDFKSYLIKRLKIKESSVINNTIKGFKLEIIKED